MENGGERKFAAFPYKAYSIQIDFMNALYNSLDKGGVSMLESPTGTFNFFFFFLDFFRDFGY